MDEIDVSAQLQLNATFFNAVPLQDNAVMEPLVDGSTITITNHILAGSATLQVLPGKGVVGRGDLIAAAHLVIASKDSMGGTFTVKELIDDYLRTTVFYGVGWRNVPHLILAGNSLVPYSMVMVYSGWIQGVSIGATDNVRDIWAVGNKYGISAIYKPFALQDKEEKGDNVTFTDSTAFDYGTLGAHGGRDVDTGNPVDNDFGSTVPGFDGVVTGSATQKEGFQEAAAAPAPALP
jgi:hypothetical protein